MKEPIKSIKMENNPSLTASEGTPTNKMDERKEKANRIRPGKNLFS